MHIDKTVKSNSIMARFYFILLIILFVYGCSNGERISSKNGPDTPPSTPDTLERTNNFYDNSQTVTLQMADIQVAGEVANPGIIKMDGLPVRSVIVKETLLDNAGGDVFIGAYRYDGYSLFDILNNIEIRKSNVTEFNPVIDLYVEIENATGDRVVFSWGEIYYHNNLHKIIIAAGVSRIVPSKSNDLWPIPTVSKIVAANDLRTERNISNPVKITVRSFPKSFETVKGLSPMYSDRIALFRDGAILAQIQDIKWENEVIYNTIFYGRGRGIHSTSPFKGIMLKDVLMAYYPAERQLYKTGLLCIAARDGYRCTVSYSELFNRNDQQEFLLVKSHKGDDGGLYRVFPACDFFSDRAVKSLTEIDLID